MMFDHKGIAYEPYERCYSLDRKEDLREVNLRAEVPTIVLDDGRIISDSTIIADEFERPDGRIHWRDSRLEWPLRHGFIDAVAKEYHAG